MNLTLPKFSKKPKRVPQRNMALHGLPPNTALPFPEDLRKKLNALSQRRLALDLGEGAAYWLRVCAVLLLAQALADWWLNLPWAVRAIFLMIDLGVLGWLGHRGIYLPWHRRLHLPGAALLAQKAFPALRGRLIASVQLAEAGTGSTQGSVALVKTLIRQTAQAAHPLDFRKAAPAGAFWRATALSSVPVVLALALAVWAWPASGVLLKRILLFPIPLPTKTTVVALTKDLHVAAGSDVELVARASGVVPRNGRVKLTYPNGQVQEVVVAPRPDAPNVFAISLKNTQRAFRYQFALNDGVGDTFAVSPLDAPAIAALECEEVWPAYTGRGLQKRDPANLMLLAGSTLRLRVKSTLPLKRATLHLESLSTTAQMKITSPDGKSAEAEIAISPNLTGFSIALSSRQDVDSIHDSVYHINVVTDEAPTLTVLRPREESETVTLAAKPPLEFEVTEDYGLKSLALCWRIEAPPIPGEQNVPSAEVKRREYSLKDIGFEPGRAVSVKSTWNLSAEQPSWREGWKIHYWIEAMDNNTVSGPAITRSSEHVWTMVSPEAKRAELSTRLKQDAEALKEISTRQENASKEVGTFLQTKSAPKP